MSGHRRVDVATARQLARARISIDVEYLLDEAEQVVVIEGGVTASSWCNDGREGAVLVIGDLVSSGDVTDQAGAITLVAGDVRCRALNLRGAFVCEGSVEVAEYVYLWSGNDYPFEVSGTLATRLLVEMGTATYASRIDAEVWRCINEVRDKGGLYPLTPRELRTVERLRELRLSGSSIAELESDLNDG